MQSLIDWLNRCSWHQLATLAKPWTVPPPSPCLDTADLLSLFFYQFSLPSSFCHEKNFLFRPVCPKRHGSVNNFRVILVLVNSIRSRGTYMCAVPLEHSRGAEKWCFTRWNKILIFPPIHPHLYNISNVHSLYGPLFSWENTGSCRPALQFLFPTSALANLNSPLYSQFNYGHSFFQSITQRRRCDFFIALSLPSTRKKDEKTNTQSS